ncbi:hypothetical protein K431DRAFT_35393 [Polychaeton citri CBS 116435]|uniref:Uncharacterized protein n=1 Tax=Polychaeton citri CBS 116435 TaxID=1314669 RepID=A0A9P4PZZ9_9PEZI|nr:hypothetical protein K431DRAFT_35393 [Polychaeton citri CBS 116435]
MFGLRRSVRGLVAWALNHLSVVLIRLRSSKFGDTSRLAKQEARHRLGRAGLVLALSPTIHYTFQIDYRSARLRDMFHTITDSLTALKLIHKSLASAEQETNKG